MIAPVEIIDQIKLCWDTNLATETPDGFPVVSDEIFTPFTGEYYHFLINCLQGRLERVHATVRAVLGYSPGEFDLSHLLGVVHPDDLAWMPFKENTVMSFFSNRLGITDTVQQYTANYMVRLRTRDGVYKKILHQAVGLDWTLAGRPRYLAVLHTDVGFLQPVIDHRVTFFGRPGMPSYYVQHTEPDRLHARESRLLLSERENEVIRHLSEGRSSKQIADRMGISKHTVDTYRRGLLRKTGCRNTAELVRYFG